MKKKIVFLSIALLLMLSTANSAFGASITLQPSAGPAAPRNFMVNMTGVGFVPDEGVVSYELLNELDQRVAMLTLGGTPFYLGHKLTNISGGFKTSFKVSQPCGTYRSHAFDDVDVDGIVDPGGAEASAYIIVDDPQNVSCL